MKKRKLKKNVKKTLIILTIYLIGILIVLLMCKNAENWNKQHAEQIKNTIQNIR